MKTHLRRFCPAAFFPALCAALLFLPSLARAEDEIGFVETFALAEDRAEALKQLIPGTDDYYYYHALNAQNRGRYDEVDKILSDWIKRNKRETPRYRELLNRQNLLRYGQKPEETLRYLRDRLGVQFNHEQEQRGVAPDLPTVLEEGKISWSAFLSQARNQSETLNLVQDRGLDKILRDGVDLTPEERRNVLNRLRYPDYPDLVQLVADDLRTRESRGFGEFEIHRQMLPEQLEALLERVPSLSQNWAFIQARLTKLRPSNDVDWRLDPVEREAYFKRLWDYASGLDPAFNSAKANILFHLLQHYQRKGEYPLDLFLTYIKLPRSAPYMDPDYLRDRKVRDHQANLFMDFREYTGLTAVTNDETLVRDYFLHVFVEANSWDNYSTFVRDDYLKKLFAEAKIVNGVGDAEKWSSFLTPSEFQALRDRVDLEFAPDNPEYFAAPDTVSLDVQVKNVKTLLVKVYEINALNFYLDQQREINTDLNLDGLVANTEKTYDYSEPPLRRMERTFTFDELKGKRGVWVVEFIGNGISSRALIRKEKLQHLARPTAAGTAITVLTQENQPAKHPAVWFGGRKYEPEGDKPILLPFTNQPGRTPLVLTDGDVATLAFQEMPGEEYELNAGIHLEREALLSGREAQVAIKPLLTLNGETISVAALEEARLLVTSTDLEGVTTTQEVPEVELSGSQASVHTFRVPQRVRSLTVSLSGKVEKISAGGAKMDLNTSRTFQLNEIDATEFVADVFFSKIGGEYVLEIFGKSGEALPDRAVSISFSHESFRPSINVALKSDPEGRIKLGSLKGIGKLTVTGNELPNRHFRPVEARRFVAANLHGKVGTPLLIPDIGFVGKVTPDAFALFERRGSTLSANRFDALSLKGGFLQANGLAAGDYTLLLKNEDKRVNILVTEGEPFEGYVLSEHRHLQVKNPLPLQIGTIDIGDKEVRIPVVNAGPDTRVHVTATRFLPEYPLMGSLGKLEWRNPSRIGRGSAESQYLSGRDIGEEYRYILERRLAAKFPGNMLGRPGLLLNPWALRDTDTGTDEAAAGEDWERSEELKEARAQAGGRQAMDMMAAEVEPGTSPDLNFLHFAAPVSFNLKPDADGVVTLPREFLLDRQHLHILATDNENSVYREVSLDEGKGTAFRDLRLTTVLDPDKHFTQVRKVTFLKEGQSLRLPDARSSEMETYDTLASVYGVMAGTNGDATFAEFAFLLRWQSLEAEAKRQLYSKYACHELNFFLSRRDPEFFDQVVKPYLANKRNKTFMDDYLLGANLESYTEPWAHGQLNMVERILLGRRLGGDRATATARHITDLFNLNPPDADLKNHYFLSALRGRGLGGGGAGLYVQYGAPINGATADAYYDADQNVEALVRIMNDPSQPAEVREEVRMQLAQMVEQNQGRVYGSSGVAAGKMAGDLSAGDFAFTPPGTMPNASPVDAFADGFADLPAPSAAKPDRARMAKDEAPRPMVEGMAGVRFGNQGGENDSIDSLIADASQLAGLEELEKQAPNLDGAQMLNYRVAAKKQALFRKLESTKEWAENNYYHWPIGEQDGDFITLNEFWKDYAAWDGQGGFYSRNFPAATSHYTEMLLALAVLDLPFEAGKHDVTMGDDNSLTLKAAGPVIVFHEEIEGAAPGVERAPILVSQNFFRNGDRYEYVENEQVEKYVRDEFLTGVVYGCQVVVTNPSAATQKLDMLLQIPQGALPVNGSEYTTSRHVALGPYSTEQQEYFFYFPAASGDRKFPHYPVHVAKNETPVAWADPFAFNVVDQLSTVDKGSWDYLSQYGTKQEVLDYLKQNNLYRISLDRIAWRAKEDVDFLREVVALLDKNFAYNETLWSYGLYHNVTPVAAEYLRHQEGLLTQCGGWLESPLVSLDPVERRWYQHLEYDPLVNARAHQLGRDRKILNDAFRNQYQQLMGALSYRPELDDEDRLAVVYFLFLQDRVEEALAWLDRVNPAGVEEKLQSDYLQAYAAMYRGQPEAAGQIAAQYAEYPVDRWKQRFAQVASQVKEIQGAADVDVTDQEDRGQQQDALAAAEPNLNFKVENQAVKLDYRNLKEVTVNYYEMDLEFLFSSNPFVTSDTERFSFIRPNLTEVKSLPGGQTKLEFPIPAAFAGKNVLVEIRGAGQKKAQAYYANSLDVQVAENYGRLQVNDAETGKPLPQTYVKVYARMNDGSTRFFKDGYTDLRGKFDYVSLNTGELDSVNRLSLLVMSETDGATVQEAGPPRQ